MTETLVAPPAVDTALDINRSHMGESRLYIVLREKIARRDLGHSVLSVAHAMMAGAHKWGKDKDFETWRKLSFRKFLGLAGDKEWDKMLQLKDMDKLIMHESGIADNPAVSMIFEPLLPNEVPNVLRHLRPVNWSELVPVAMYTNATGTPRAAPLGVWGDPLDDIGDLMPVADWKECVDEGGFVDYDGYGHPVKHDMMDGRIILKPGRARYDIPDDATHVMWYNR